MNVQLQMEAVDRYAITQRAAIIAPASLAT